MPLDKPFEKSNKTVTFVGTDGQKLEVISNISKAALKILRKQGYKKESEHLKDLEAEAIKKHGLDDEDDDAPEDDDDDSDPDEHDPPKPPDTISTGPDLQVKKAAPAKAAGRRS